MNERPDPRPQPLVKANVGKGAGIAAGALAAATLIVAAWEGERRVGYMDIIGVPTYCYGGTGPEAVVGKRYSADECRTQLAEDVRSHAKPLTRCITAKLPDKTYAAIISLSFNMGTAGVCKTAPYRPGKTLSGQGLIWYFNNGHYRLGCAALERYVYAGGRRIRGLENRRRAERALCEKGLEEWSLISNSRL